MTELAIVEIVPVPGANDDPYDPAVVRVALLRAPR